MKVLRNTWIMGSLIIFSLSHRPVSFAESPKKVGQVIEIIGNQTDFTYSREQEKGSLKVADSIFYKDAVLTGPTTTAKLELKPDADTKVDLFLHENSKLVIEGFVLDSQGKKNFVARFMEGVLKVIANGFSEDKKMLIYTPNGIVGVRGTAFTSVAGKPTSTDPVYSCAKAFDQLTFDQKARDNSVFFQSIKARNISDLSNPTQYGPPTKCAQRAGITQLLAATSKDPRFHQMGGQSIYVVPEGVAPEDLKNLCVALFFQIMRFLPPQEMWKMDYKHPSSDQEDRHQNIFKKRIPTEEDQALPPSSDVPKPALQR